MDDQAPPGSSGHPTRRIYIDITQELVEELAASLRRDDPSLPLTESWEIARATLESANTELAKDFGI